MNGYICLKPVRFGDRQYNKGEAIPDDAVLSSRAPTLKRLGIIADTAETSTQCAENSTVIDETESWVSLPINTENGIMELPVTREDIIRAVEIMQQSAIEAAKAVGTVKSEETLIMIDACDSRKAVKGAIKTTVVQIKNESTETSGTPEGESHQDGDE